MLTDLVYDRIADLPTLQELSGLKQPAAVQRWLAANGVAFMVQPSGDPVTTLDAINRALRGNSKFNRPHFSPAPSRRPGFKKKLAATQGGPPNRAGKVLALTSRPKEKPRQRALPHQRVQKLSSLHRSGDE
jgi:hypothetical protein